MMFLNGIVAIVFFVASSTGGSLPPTYHYQFWGDYSPGVLCSKSTPACSDTENFGVPSNAAGVFNSTGYCNLLGGVKGYSAQALDPTVARSKTGFTFTTLIGGLYKITLIFGSVCTCDLSFNCVSGAGGKSPRIIIGSFANLNVPLKDKNFQNCHCAPNIDSNAIVFSIASCPPGSIYTIFTTDCNLCPSGSFQNLSAPIANPARFVTSQNIVDLDVPDVVFPQPCSPAPAGFYVDKVGQTEVGLITCGDPLMFFCGLYSNPNFI
jgi:hypothetical protein